MKSNVVQSSNSDQNYGQKSELSLMDSLQPSFHLNIAFFYDYTVEISLLKEALEKLLNRYPEFAGRVDYSENVINLNNKGAILLNLQESDISLDDLISRNFNFEYCLENLKPKYQIPDEYPLGLTVQSLAGNLGMMLNFTIDHALVDANACYVILADFCSLVRTGDYKFEKVQQSNRCQYTKLSENVPRLPHPEIRTFKTEEDMKSFAGPALAAIFANPPIMVNFIVDNEKLGELKRDVYSSASYDEIRIANIENVLPSTNDCLMALVYKACLESGINGKKASTDDGGSFHPPLGLFVNIRSRRNPKIPFTHIANGVLATYTQMPKSLDISIPFNIAYSIRKDIAKTNEDYCQSYEAHIRESKFCRFAGMFHTSAIMFTNWNKLYNWYESTNLGRGNPLKFFQLDPPLDRACLINDAPNGKGLDVYVALTKEHMTAFMEHESIKKYFKAL